MWGGAPDCEHAWDTGRIPPNSGSLHSPKQQTKGSENYAIVPERFYDICTRCGAWRGELGSEPTPEQYVANIVAVFRAVRRVLRDDGTLWLNLGDSYASSPPGNKTLGVSGASTLHGADSTKYRETLSQSVQTRGSTLAPGLKPKDLVGIPWRVAFALQADGWYLRSDIIWSKPNPMPESVTDRPTKAHEYLFLLSKRAEYYYDADAIKESSVSDHPSGNGYKRDARLSYRDPHGARGNDEQWQVQSHRNRRSVWTIPTEAYPAAHFATFPRKLVEPCILAGTSARGQCPACGAPWRRVVAREDAGRRRPAYATNGVHAHYPEQEGGTTSVTLDHYIARQTTGWEPTCSCNAGDPVPQLVLDPFLGSGTTAYVARHHGRRAVGIELNESYARLAADRLRQGVLGLEVW